MKNQKILFTGFGLLSILLLSLVVFQSFSHTDPVKPTKNVNPADETRVQKLLNDIQSMDIATMPAQEIQSFVLPKAGVHVMRVKIEETYTIEGIGTETVELSGWIAVKHDHPRALDNNMPISWDNSKVPTEFVGMDLQGESEIFGPVRVRLNQGQPSIGQVGGIELPGGFSLDDSEMQSEYAMPPLPIFPSDKK